MKHIQRHVQCFTRNTHYGTLRKTFLVIKYLGSTYIFTVYRPSIFLQTISKDHAGKEDVTTCVSKNELDCGSRNISTYRQVTCLCDGGIQFCDNSFPSSEMEPRSRYKPNSIFASLHRLLLSFTRETQVVPIQQENNSISYVLHTASFFTQTEIVSLAQMIFRM
jgi:hypothetical protein